MIIKQLCVDCSAGGEKLDDKNKRNDKKNGDQIKKIIVVIIITLVLTTFINRVITRYNRGSETEISYDTFVQMLEDKEVESVTIQDGTYTVVPKEQANPLSKTTYTVTAITDYKIVDRLNESGAEFQAQSSDGSDLFISFLATWVLPFILLYGFFYLMMRNQM